MEIIVFVRLRHLIVGVEAQIDVVQLAVIGAGREMPEHPLRAAGGQHAKAKVSACWLRAIVPRVCYSNHPARSRRRRAIVPDRYLDPISLPANCRMRISDDVFHHQIGVG